MEPFFGGGGLNKEHLNMLLQQNYFDFRFFTSNFFNTRITNLSLPEG